MISLTQSQWDATGPFLVSVSAMISWKISSMGMSCMIYQLCYIAGRLLKQNDSARLISNAHPHTKPNWGFGCSPRISVARDAKQVLFETLLLTYIMQTLDVILSNPKSCCIDRRPRSLPHRRSPSNNKFSNRFSSPKTSRPCHQGPQLLAQGAKYQATISQHRQRTRLLPNLQQHKPLQRNIYTAREEGASGFVF